MLTDKSQEEGISFYIDAAGFHHEYNPPEEVRSIQTMAWQLKNESLHHHCTAKGSYVAWEEKQHISLWQQYIRKVLFYVNSMKAKLMETYSEISSKHTFKKFSVDTRFQKAKDFFKMDVLYKIVKRQDKLQIQLAQSYLAYLLVHQILIIQKIFLIISKVNCVLRLLKKHEL